MKRNIHIQEELEKTTKVIANIPFVNPYQVGSTYFEELTASILLQINKTNSYKAPAGYFEGLSNSILNKIKQEEALNDTTDELPAILQGLQKRNPYTVPQGYFEQLELVVKEEGKVVQLVPKKRRHWIKYAAAACIVAIISFTAVNFWGKKPANAEDKLIAGTNVTYKEIKNLNVDAELEKLNNNELDNYLCENGWIACNEPKIDADLDKQLDNLNISDEDLDALLEATN